MSQRNNIVIWYNKTLLAKYIYIKSYKPILALSPNANLQYLKIVYQDSSYNSQITSTKSISFTNHYYIRTCTSVVTSDITNMSMTPLAMILPNRVWHLLLVEYVVLL